MGKCYYHTQTLEPNPLQTKHTEQIPYKPPKNSYALNHKHANLREENNYALQNQNKEIYTD